MTRRRSQGFTLTEIAIAFTIVALLLAGFMYTLAAQTAARERSDTLRRLEEARELLVTFAIVNGRLPCPAAAPPNFPFNGGGTGVESPDAAVPPGCTDAYTGFLPARTLGFQPADANGYALDAWNNPIRYAVSRVSSAGNWNFTGVGSMKTNGIGVTPSDLVICAQGTGTTAVACAGAPQVTNMNLVVAVLWSQGKNFREKTAGGIAAAALGTDETLNHKHLVPAVMNNTPVFVYTTPAPSGAPGGEYDDLMVWLPVGTLYGRLVAAGVLP